MNWNKLTETGQIAEIKELSKNQPVMIFKHSTRCSISSMALDRMLRNWKEDDGQKISPFFLDLIQYRQLSDLIAQEFGVMHESPQVILVEKGQVTYDRSHYGISYQELMGKI